MITSAALPLLTIRCGPLRLAMPVQEVAQVARPRFVPTPPGAPAWLSGLAMVAGNAVWGIQPLAACTTTHPLTSGERLAVVLAPGVVTTSRIALLVDAVEGLGRWEVPAVIASTTTSVSETAMIAAIASTLGVGLFRCDTRGAPAWFSAPSTWQRCLDRPAAIPSDPPLSVAGVPA